MPLSPVITALDDNWTRTRTTPTATAALQAWATGEPALRPYDDLRALEAHVQDRATSSDDVDAVFAALLRTHHLDDPAAGSVVLALLLPAIKRRRPHDDDAEDHTAAVLDAVWDGICRYPLQRRPSRIPANLILDAHRAAAPPKSGHQKVRWCDQSPPPISDETWIERIHTRFDLELAAIAAGIGYSDLHLIARTRVAGWPVADLANGTGAARLRKRRRRAEARLAHHLPIASSVPA